MGRTLSFSQIVLESCAHPDVDKCLEEVQNAIKAEIILLFYLNLNFQDSHKKTEILYKNGIRIKKKMHVKKRVFQLMILFLQIFFFLISY